MQPYTRIPYPVIPHFSGHTPAMAAPAPARAPRGAVMLAVAAIAAASVVIYAVFLLWMVGSVWLIAHTQGAAALVTVWTAICVACSGIGLWLIYRFRN